MKACLTPSLSDAVLFLAGRGLHLLPQEGLRSMCGRRRKRNFGVLRHGIEEVFELLERIFGKTVADSNPDARDDCLFDPRLVFLSKKARIDQVVQYFTGGHVARSSQREAVGVYTYVYLCSLSL